jgi:abequosyltransferase
VAKVYFAPERRRKALGLPGGRDSGRVAAPAARAAMNPKLAIAIPTHNRLEILREQLRLMLPELREAGVEVFVSDSGTDDATEVGIRELQAEWAGIHYRRSPPGLEYDWNCAAALSMPATEYVWYLGDALRILPGGIRRVLAALEETPCDLLVVNDVSRPPIGVPSGLLRDPARILEGLAWHMTLAGTLVFSREQLADLERRYARYFGGAFLHLAIVLENVPSYRRGLLWLDERWVAAHRSKRSGWVKVVIEIWAGRWCALFDALPAAYPEESKRIAVRSHSLRTGVLEWIELGRRRRERAFDLRRVRAHREQLARASGVPPWVAELLAAAPRFLAMPIVRVGRLVARALGSATP